MEMDDCHVNDDSFIERRRLFNHADMIINTCLYKDLMETGNWMRNWNMRIVSCAECALPSVRDRDDLVFGDASDFFIDFIHRRCVRFADLRHGPLLIWGHHVRVTLGNDARGENTIMTCNTSKFLIATFCAFAPFKWWFVAANFYDVN